MASHRERSGGIWIVLLALVALLAVLVGPASIRFAGDHATRQAALILSIPENTTKLRARALEYIHLARWLTPADPRLARLEGIHKFQSGDLTGAELSLRAYGEVEPVAWGPYFRAWTASRRAGKPTAALGSDPAASGAELLPEVALALFWLAFEGGEGSAAQELLARAAPLAGAHHGYHTARAFACVRSGDLKQAVDELERARELSAHAPPPSPLTLLVRGSRFLFPVAGTSVTVQSDAWSGDLVTEQTARRQLAIGLLSSLAALYHARGEYPRAILTAQNLGSRYARELGVLGLKEIVSRLSYPVLYPDAIRESSLRFNVDPCLVLALIREETHFDAAAISGPGAMGLMQIMPETGKWIADQLRISGFNSGMLLNPITSIEFGAWYFDYLMRALGGDTGSRPWVLAAYNGGIGNVTRWMKQARDQGKDYTQVIAFPETRDYIRKVEESYRTYREIYPELAELRPERPPVQVAPVPASGRRGPRAGRRSLASSRSGDGERGR